MQDLLLLLLPMALLILVGRGLLRRAPPIDGMRARLAAVKWALVRDFSTALLKDVVVTDRVTAHHLLVRAAAGGAFCNRPPTSAASFVLSRQRHHNISSAPYGPLWRAIRRNLVSEVFHPSRLRLHAPARRRALRGLLADLHEQCTSSFNSNGGGVALAASFVLTRQRHHNISSAPYGPLWRAIRRNLVSEVFHPSRLRLHAPARRRALRGLLADLHEQCTSSFNSNGGGVALAAESMHATLFGLSAAMCFGNNVDAARVRVMADAMEDLIRSLVGLSVFAALPALTELIYRKRWNKLVALRRQQEELYLPLINTTRDRRRGRTSGSAEAQTYVDTLLDLLVADESCSASGGNNAPKQRLTDGELVGLCAEFLGAGTEPATAALQWVMANLVKHPDVQEAVRREIDAVVGEDAEEVGEEDLGRLEYLHAVLMEALRLHPTVPSLSRQVIPEDHIVLDGRRATAGTTVQFPLERLARDKTAWADPDEFRPKRFLAGGEGDGVSLVAAAGSAGEIRMMPFGAGRRMCPGMGVAMLHLGYFVANLVREFHWTEAGGDMAVDLEAHVGFLNVMKRPLRARLVPRPKTE